MRWYVASVLLLSACSGGLTALRESDDTGNPGNPDDSDIGEPNNAAPVADAGADQGVDVGDVVLLDASGSEDPDGDDIAYDWDLVEKPAGSSTSLVNERHVDPQ